MIEVDRNIHLQDFKPYVLGEELLEHLNDQAFNKFLCSRYSKLTLSDIVEHHETLAKEDTHMSIWYGLNFVGTLKLVADFYDSKKRHISILSWKTGVGTAVISFITKYAFTVLDITTLIAGMEQGNKACRRIFEKAGYESLESRTRHYGGEWHTLDFMIKRKEDVDYGLY